MSRTKKQTPAPEAPKIQTLNVEEREKIHRLFMDIRKRMAPSDPDNTEELVVMAYTLGRMETMMQYPITDLEQLVRRNGSE